VLQCVLLCVLQRVLQCVLQCVTVSYGVYMLRRHGRKIFAYIHV